MCYNKVMHNPRKTLVMGIVNVTPDSFSDGGRFFRPEEAIRRARNLAAEGADLLDLGAESTRPGATPISAEEEWSRLEPVLDGLVGKTAARLSVDTYHPETARLALAAGADVINCVYPDPVPAMLELLEECPQAELVLPAQARERCPEALRARCWFDPMIGFGTTREEDLELLRTLPELAKQGRVLVGVSRKRIVRKLMLGDAPTAAAKHLANQAGKLLGANLALAVWAAMNGADCLRVHDVAETVQALNVLRALADNAG